VINRKVLQLKIRNSAGQGENEQKYNSANQMEEVAKALHESELDDRDFPEQDGPAKLEAINTSERELVDHPLAALTHFDQT